MHAQNLVAVHVKEPARGLGDQHRASVAGEQQNAILEVAENLVEILLQRGKHLLNITHTLAKTLILCETLAAMSWPFNFSSGCGVSLGPLSKSSCWLICSMGRKARLPSRKATSSAVLKTKAISSSASCSRGP